MSFYYSIVCVHVLQIKVLYQRDDLQKFSSILWVVFSFSLRVSFEAQKVLILMMSVFFSLCPVCFCCLRNCCVTQGHEDLHCVFFYEFYSCSSYI